MISSVRGLLLPANDISIMLSAFVVFIIWLLVLSRQVIVFTSALRLLALATGVLAIPLLYAPAHWVAEAGWRIAGLAAGVLFYFSCLQVRYTPRILYAVLGGVLLLVGIQAILALLQLFAPDWAWVPLYGQRAYGSFRQPNVLGSFIASGLGLVLTLFLLPGLVLKKARYVRCERGVLGVLLLVFTALLVWVQSRAGWLGGAVMVLLFLWCFGRHFPRRSAAACAVMLLGVGLGAGVLLFGDAAGEVITHSGSNHARWSMLRDTLAMIIEKPWLGWGYGGYEYSFQHFRINQIPPTIVTETSRHPHNEVLLWVAEGGGLALIGVLLALAAGLCVVRKAIRHDREAFTSGGWSAGLPTALCIVLIPIVIHSQLEYPFYLSALHFLLFLLLLAMADRLGAEGEQRRRLAPGLHVAVASGMSMLALAMAVVMGYALTGVNTLTQVERRGLVDIAPLQAMPALAAWVHQERKVFDEQVHALLTYNHTKDEQLLVSYSQWAQDYLARRVDKNVYASLIQILQHQGEGELADQYRLDAMRLFPRDPRFQPQ